MVPASIRLAALLALLPGAALAGPSDVIRDRGAVRVDRAATAAVGTDRLRLQRLVGLLQARAPELGWSGGLRSGMTLTPRSQPLTGGQPGELVQITATIDGIPLAHPLAHVVLDDRDGTLRLLVSEGPVGPLVADPLAALPEATDALDRLARSGTAGSRGARNATLVAVPGRSETRLAWRIDPPLDWSSLTNPVFLVDAKTGAIEMAYDHVRTAKVLAFERNPTRDPEPAEFELIHLDQDAQNLSGPYFRAENCTVEGSRGSCEAGPTAVPDTDGNFLYPAPNVAERADNIQPNDEFSEVSMYYHADKFLEHLRDHGFAGLPCHLEDQPATLVANYKRYDDSGEWMPFDNAFYSGDCDSTMVFGQGTDVDFAYDGDVIYHELGHGVVETQRDGGYLGGIRLLEEALAVDAGGINEAVADFVSSSFAGDPIVADYIGAHWERLEDQKAIRDNANDYVCPHDLVGELHLDGEPFAALMWLAYVEFGEAMIPVVLDTTSAVARDATLGEAASTLGAMAEMHVGSDAAAFIDAEAEARGLHDCLRITTPDRLRREMFVKGNRSFDPFAPPPLQLEVEVPTDADEVTVSFHAEARTGSFGDSGSDFEPALLIKHGVPVTFTYEERSRSVSVETDADDSFDGLTDSVTFSATPGETVYLAFTNLGQTEMTLDDITVAFSGTGDGGDPGDDGDGGRTGDGDSGDSDTGDGTTGTDGDSVPEEDPTGTTGTDDATGEPGLDGSKGCACRSSAQGGPGAPLLALLGLLGLWAPRRRSSRRASSGRKNAA